MLEKINQSTNLLSAVLILCGAVLCLKDTSAGMAIISGGFGVFGGGQMAKSSTPNP